MARDVIFDKNKVWNRRLTQLSLNNIKELDKAIKIVKMLQTNNMEDIQLAKDLEIDKSILTHSITQHANHETKILDEKIENTDAEKRAKVTDNK